MRSRPPRVAVAAVAGRARLAVLCGVLAVGPGALPARAATGCPSAEAPMCSAAPAIDGVLTDACWNAAARLSEFYIHQDPGGARTNDPGVRLLRDDKFLYLALDCANPHMRFLNQHGVAHDDSGVGHDDSIELFLTRDGLPRYYHYLLNYANVQSERRIGIVGGSVSRDLAWSYPWISATARREDGWTAEVAIPLELLNAKTPGDVRLNIMRNRVVVELDMMGAKISERKAFHLWAPITTTVHDPGSFGVVSGLRDALAAPAPLLVEIDGLRAGELTTAGDAFQFGLNATLLGVTPVAGDVAAEVVQATDGGAPRVLVGTNLALPPRCQVPLAMTVPVDDFAPRKLALRLTDRATGLVLDTEPLPFEGTLIKDLYPEFSFYSREPTVRVKVVLDLAPAALTNMALALETRDGKTIAREERPSPETVLAAEVGTLGWGANPLTVKLVRKDGKVFGARAVTVTRLKDAGVPESKVDHFRRIVLFKGQPYFPYGMVDGASFVNHPAVMKAYIQALQSARMNTLFLQDHVHENFDIENVKTRLTALADAQINVIFGCGIHPVVRDLDGIKTQEEKERLMRERYRTQFEPNILRLAALLKTQPNLLTWYGMDEANLGDWQSKLFAAGLFRETQQQADPYRVVYSVYARTIPRVPEATDYFDVLGFDIYTYPDWDNVHARIGDPMAAQIAELDARAAEKRQPIWTMPQPAALDPGRCPRPLTGQDVLCEAYTALIHGSKGILYFTYLLANSEETWQALETLGRQIEALAPAVLHDPVRQELAYASGTYDAARWQIPAVPLRVFRYPDDRLVALAVNSKTFPVDLTLTIRGLAGAARLFAGEGALAVKDGAFTDSLEPHAVRAYALKASGDPAAALAVSIVTQEHPDQAPAAGRGNEQWLANVRAGKNLILNPSFEMQKIPGRPDGYMPYKVVRLRATREAPADYALDKDNPKFGTVSLRLSHPAGYRWAGVFGLSLAPKERGRPHVFSFYARAQAAGTRLWVGLPAAAGWHERTFTLTAEWARYSMPCPSPGGPVLLQASGKGDQAETIWLDGLQLEAGETPTEFSEP